VLVSDASRYDVSPATGTVIVRGLPADIAAVRHYLTHLNREVLRPITVTVRLLNVSRTRGANFETDIMASLNRVLDSRFNLDITGEVGDTTIRLVRPVTPAAPATSAEVAIQALRSLGTVSRVLTAGVPSLNGKPAQYYELFRDTYLERVRTSTTEGTVSTELTPGTVSSGFAFSYMGRITGPGRALLRVFVSLQDRPAFETFQSGGNLIQLPEFASRGINVSQAVNERETLVIAGFSERAATSDRAGVGHPDNIALGGRQTADLSVNEIVLLLSLEIGDSPPLQETPETLL